MTTHYNVLGVKNLNHISNIKKAYHKLALKHHPDKGGLEKNFKHVQEAWEILSDKDKRHAYNNKLEEIRRIKELEKILEAERLEAEQLEAEHLESLRKRHNSKTYKKSRHNMNAIRRAVEVEAKAYNVIRRAQIAHIKASATLGRKLEESLFTRKNKSRKN
jgi:curved DNA-binding protein CbpA